MSDYSFMKTGLDSPEGTINIELLEEINILISFITSNAMIRASEYVTISNRDVITKHDFIMGMKYEAFTLMNNQNFQEELNKYKEEYFSEVYGENEEEELQESEQKMIEESENQLVEGCTIVNDESQLTEFTRISSGECNSLSQKEKKFIQHMHQFSDHWTTFNPSNQFQKLIKHAVDMIEKAHP